MDSGLIGVAGIVVGATFGATTKYFTRRRDAWLVARTAGLLLLADVRALARAERTDPIVSATGVGVRSWEAQRETLAAFRRGNYPNGLRASEWLALAGHFANLGVLSAVLEADRDSAWWDRVRPESAAADHLLRRFEYDPSVFGYVVLAGLVGKARRDSILAGRATRSLDATGGPDAA
jgi:hypothetical protein